MSERFMGEFDPKATYKKGDVVTLNGEAYRRVRDDGGKVNPFQTMPYRVWQKKSAASGGLVNLLGGPGGGGGTSDAVQYIPQELTEEQQMQARKNLGVYGKTSEAVEISFGDVGIVVTRNGVPENVGFDRNRIFAGYYRLFDEPLSDGEIKTMVSGETAVSRFWDRLVSTGAVTADYTYAEICISVRAENTLIDGDVFENIGTYLMMSCFDVGVAYVSGTIHPIPPEYLPGTFVPTAIIKSSDYDNALAGVSTMASDPEASDASYECINMTFEEAMQYVTEGRQLTVCLMFVLNSIPTISNASVQLVSENGERFLYAYTTGSSSFGLVWKSDGLTKN